MGLDEDISLLEFHLDQKINWAENDLHRQKKTLQLLTRVIYEAHALQTYTTSIIQSQVKVDDNIFVEQEVSSSPKKETAFPTDLDEILKRAKECREPKMKVLKVKESVTNSIKIVDSSSKSRHLLIKSTEKSSNLKTLNADFTKTKVEEKKNEEL